MQRKTRVPVRGEIERGGRKGLAVGGLRHHQRHLLTHFAKSHTQQSGVVLRLSKSQSRRYDIRQKPHTDKSLEEEEEELALETWVVASLFDDNEAAAASTREIRLLNKQVVIRVAFVNSSRIAAAAFRDAESRLDGLLLLLLLREPRAGYLSCVCVCLCKRARGNILHTSHLLLKIVANLLDLRVTAICGVMG